MSVEASKPPLVSDRITTREAGRRVNLSTERIRQLFDTGTLKGERTPLGRLVSLDSVEELIRSRATK
jgi:hypothetical protein